MLSAVGGDIPSRRLHLEGAERIIKRDGIERPTGHGRISEERRRIESRQYLLNGGHGSDVEEIGASYFCSKVP